MIRRGAAILETGIGALHHSCPRGGFLTDLNEDLKMPICHVYIKSCVGS